METLAQQNKLKNIIVDYIRALQEEKERLRRIQNPQGIIDILNFKRMSIFDLENYNNIVNHLLELDNAINTLNGLLGNSNELSVENLQNTMNEINQKQSYAMKTIEAIGRTKRNQIAVTTLGSAVIGLSIAIAVLTFGTATPLMIGLDTAFFAVGVGATALGAKSIHDRKKALLKLKIEKEIMPTPSEIFFYQKMIRDILLQAKGKNEFTTFQEQLYRQIDTEYDLRKKIEEQTPLTRIEKFFHKSMIRRILQEKISNGEQLSDYANALCQEVGVETNRIEQEADADGNDLPLSDLEDNPNNRISVADRVANAQIQTANQDPQANITTPLLQSNMT